MSSCSHPNKMSKDVTSHHVLDDLKSKEKFTFNSDFLESWQSCSPEEYKRSQEECRNLPVLEAVVREIKQRSAQSNPLSSTVVITRQHLTEPTNALFESFFQLGLQKDNLYVLGKNYSTCPEVMKNMLEKGIDVSFASFQYSSSENMINILVKQEVVILSYPR